MGLHNTNYDAWLLLVKRVQYWSLINTGNVAFRIESGYYVANKTKILWIVN